MLGVLLVQQYVTYISSTIIKPFKVNNIKYLYKPPSSKVLSQLPFRSTPLTTIVPYTKLGKESLFSACYNQTFLLVNNQTSSSTNFPASRFQVRSGPTGHATSQSE